MTVRPWCGALLTAGVFMLIFGVWALFPRELFRQECVYAVQALEATLQSPMVTVHETPVRNAYPMYPALCSLIYRFSGLPMEMVLRLVTLLFIAAAAVLVYFSAAVGNDKRAGLVGAAMYCTTLLMIDKGVSGAPQAMSAFWLLAAQMAFFYFGLRRGRWGIAWPLCAVLLMAGFFTGGFLVIALFVIPLLILRRLLSGKAKFRNFGFFIAAAMVLVGCLLRLAVLWRFEKLTGGGTLFFRGFADPDYLGDFLLYWFRLPLRLLPWSFIAWIPFCTALQQLDTKPLFSKYLRTLIFVIAALLWLVPKTDERELFYLLGPLAILTGIYYELGMRRFGERLRKLLPVAEYMALLTAMMFFVGLWGEEKLLKKVLSLGLTLNFRQAPELFSLVLLAVGCVLGTGVLLRWFRSRIPVWCVLLAVSFMGGVFYSVIMLRYQAQDNSKGNFGRMVHGIIKKDMGSKSYPLEIYKSGANGLYGELFYTGARIIQLPSADQLPDHRSRTIYFLSSSFPQNPKWSWTNLMPENFTYGGERIMLWRGKRNFQEKFNAQ